MVHRIKLTVRHENNIEFRIVQPKIGKNGGHVSIGQSFISCKENNLLVTPAYPLPDLTAKIIFNRREVSIHVTAVVDPISNRCSFCPLVCASVWDTAMRQKNWNTLQIGVFGIQRRLAYQKRRTNYDRPRETTHP